MLFFLRRLRQALIKKNKFTTYLLYAFGEILLVVLGILIAVSINNANQASKERDYEKKILGEIYVNLKGEHDRRSKELVSYQRAEKSLKVIINYMNEKIERPDTLMRLIRNLDIRRFFIANQGAYETLKFQGLDKISNDSLRKSLVKHYEETSEGSSHMINEVLRPAIVENVEFQQTLFSKGLFVAEDGSIRYNSKEPDRRVLRSEAFAKMLRNANMIQNQLGLYTGLILRENLALQLQIEHELNIPNSALPTSQNP